MHYQKWQEAAGTPERKHWSSSNYQPPLSPGSWQFRASTWVVSFRERSSSLGWKVLVVVGIAVPFHVHASSLRVVGVAQIVDCGCSFFGTSSRLGLDVFLKDLLSFLVIRFCVLLLVSCFVPCRLVVHTVCAHARCVRFTSAGWTTCDKEGFGFAKICLRAFSIGYTLLRYFVLFLAVFCSLPFRVV